MRKLILAIVLLLNVFFVQADQLAYLSKADAEKGADLLKKQKFVYLFCGCCDNDVAQKVKVKSVEVRYTGYEEFYEIFVISETKEGKKEYSLDLAYAWLKVKKSFKTVGSILSLEHDPCKEFQK